ncbi:AI-2E family transporter [Azospirillaceae bacterium]
MNAHNTSRFWVGAIGGAALISWLLRDTLPPFVVGVAVAYLLDPVVDWLSLRRIPRGLAAGVVLLFFVLLFTAVLFLIVPLIQAQVVEFVDMLPRYAGSLRETLQSVARRLLLRLSPDDVERLRAAVGEYAGEIIGWIGKVLEGVLSGGMAIFDVASILLVTPVVSFYLLRDWRDLGRRINSWLPCEHAPIIRRLIIETDHILAGFIHGQAMACVMLAVYYAVALSALGVNFGLLVGLLTGALAFVPYVGFALGFLTALGLTMVQFGTWGMIGATTGVFAIGQVLETNLITPRFVGEKIGLHPVWVMFALLAGGNLCGFVGVLLAVPVAAVIGVLARFGLEQYLASSYYLGRRDVSDEAVSTVLMERDNSAGGGRGV